jgi:hypothetical protein
MLLGVEFVVKNPISIASGSFFRSMLLHNKDLLIISQGEDIYNVDVALNPQDILAALGRKRRVNATAEERNESGSLKPIKFPYSKSDGVRLLIISDLFLKEDELTKTLELRLSPSGGDAITVPLKRVEWIGRGMFAIDIAAPVKEMFEKSDSRPFPTAINS